MTSLTNKQLREICEVSNRAQKTSYNEQDIEFKKLLNEKIQSLKCIGCQKSLTFYEWKLEDENLPSGYFYNGALIVDTIGYGSCKFDMAKIAILVCDDCIEKNAIYSQWLDKLNINFKKELKNEN